MAFIQMDSNGNPVDVGQPGSRAASVPDAPEAGNGQMREATYRENPGQTRIEFRAGQGIDKTGPKQVGISVREGGSLASAVDESSMITDRTGEVMSVGHALRAGYITKGAAGYVATAEYADLFGEVVVSPALADEVATANTNTDTAETQAGPFTTEASSKFVAEIVGKVGDAPILYALETALVEGNEDVATKLVADLAQVSGVEKFSEQFQTLVSDRLNAARSLVTAEVGLDAAEVEAWEQHLQADPRALRDVRAAVASGNKDAVVAAARQYADQQLLSGYEIDPVQDIHVDGQRVFGKVYTVNGKHAVELEDGRRFWLSQAKVSRIEAEL